MNDESSPSDGVFSVRSRRASRQAIGFLMQQGIENRSCLSLAAGFVDESSLPLAECLEAATSVLSNTSRGRGALQYGTTQGDEGFRNSLLAHLARLEGRTVEQLGIGADRLVVTTGSQQLLALVADALFDPGDICLVAMPTYFVFLGVLDGVGARTIGVEADENGMRMDALAATLADLEQRGELDRVKLIYLVTDFENPSGACLADDRRSEVLRLAQQYSRRNPIYILEDAAYRELRYDGPSIPSIWSRPGGDERVILAMTFSKSFSPGVRTGFGVLPRPLMTPVCNLKGNLDFGSSQWNQALLTHVLKSGAYVAHLEQVKASYRTKRDALLRAADEFLADIPGVSWLRPEGGLYVWLSLPEHIETGFASPLFHTATRQHGVMYVPGELCYPTVNGQSRAHQMRLSFGVLPPDNLREGIRRLSGAIRDVLKSAEA
ncbi:MAG: PLP-dependent aminotransferase family protein [Planctomycetaceae bacterium]|nr:PLP-dependent aminotransferase family protein [Planctomycetaceae bacterium]